MEGLTEGTRALIHQAVPGARVTDVKALGGGISSRMLLVGLDDAEAPGMVVRAPHPTTPRDLTVRAEADLLDHVVDAAIPAPRVLAVDDHHLVLEFIDGEPVLDDPDPIGRTQAMARMLARIHAIALPRTGLARRDDLVARHLAVVGSQLDDRLRERLIRDALIERWPPADHQDVLLHGDFWPGNLVWRDHEIAGVVDWEDAAIGDRHSDVSISRLDLLWVFGLDAAEAFTEAYDAIVALDADRLALWDVVAALRPCGALASWATAWPALGRPDITEATMRRDHASFLERALARLSC